MSFDSIRSGNFKSVKDHFKLQCAFLSLISLHRTVPIRLGLIIGKGMLHIALLRSSFIIAINRSIITVKSQGLICCSLGWWSFSFMVFPSLNLRKVTSQALVSAVDFLHYGNQWNMIWCIKTYIWFKMKLFSISCADTFFFLP